MAIKRRRHVSLYVFLPFTRWRLTLQRRSCRIITRSTLIGYTRDVRPYGKHATLGGNVIVCSSHVAKQPYTLRLPMALTILTWDLCPGQNQRLIFVKVVCFNYCVLKRLMLFKVLTFTAWSYLQQKSRIFAF